MPLTTVAQDFRQIAHTITAPCTASGATVRKKYGSMPESVIDVDAIEITGIFSATMLL